MSTPLFAYVIRERVFEAYPPRRGELVAARPSSLGGKAIIKRLAGLPHEELAIGGNRWRLSGEEFFLLLIETSISEALPIAQRLRQLVEIHPVRSGDELLTQTVSIGMAGFSQRNDTLELLIERADEALYAAKRAGRNRVAAWPLATIKRV